MIQLTGRDIIAHQASVPWPNKRQVEQDLLLCHAMTALFSDDFLKTQIAMRGGTLLHKVHLLQASAGSRLSVRHGAPLLRTGLSYDPCAAGEYVIDKLLGLLPEDE